MQDANTNGATTTCLLIGGAIRKMMDRLDTTHGWIYNESIQQPVVDIPLSELRLVLVATILDCALVLGLLKVAPASVLRRAGIRLAPSIEKRLSKKSPK